MNPAKLMTSVTLTYIFHFLSIRSKGCILEAKNRL